MLDMECRIDVDQVIERFEEMTRNARRVQRETLEKILEENMEAEYLVKLGLDGRTDPASFRACVPLVTHSDIEPYISRILDGDSSPVLTGKPITTMSISSGTTYGRRKYLPFNDHLFENTMQIYQTSFAYRNKEFPIEKDSISLQFIYSSGSSTSKPSKNSSITTGTATTNLFRHPNYHTRMLSIRSQPCTPSPIISSAPPTDFHQSLYCHLISGLTHRHEIQFISSTFAHSLVHAFDSLTRLYPLLISDIQSGSLNTDLVTDETLRNAMSSSSSLRRPDPDNADSIRQIFQDLIISDRGGWDGIIPALFPNAKYVYAILTGSMEPYVKKLRKYCGREFPLIAADYGASEGWIAVNVNPKKEPECATFVVVPNVGYFEFLPVSNEEEEDDAVVVVDPVGLTQVEIGQEYEVVVTNFAGLYRYKLGDVVKVVGFHNSAPEIKFVCRRNLILNINIDKTTEKDLHLAVEQAAEILAAAGVELVDFTSRVESSVVGPAGHYVVFWEMATTSSGGGDHDADEDCSSCLVVDESVLQKCCDCMDMAFVDIGYVGARKSGGIGALEMRVVKRGTFRRVMDYYLGLGNTANQFKTPRCVGLTNKPVLHILEQGVVKTYFSHAYNREPDR